MSTIRDAFQAGAERFRLSQRQREVMWRILAGDSGDDIADRLGITRNTVNVHVTSVLKKTGEPTRNRCLEIILGIDDD